MKKFKKTALSAALAVVLSVGTAHCSFAAVQQDGFVSGALTKTYSSNTDSVRVMEALEMLKNTTGEYSRKAILGDNLTSKPVRIEFKDLSSINPNYANFDALGWKKRGKLYIYINKKHQDAPKEALAALLAHEAIHQDEYNSLNEETYAWTLEAAVWTQLSDENPKIMQVSHPLVERENVIRKLFLKGNYTNQYIRKFVTTNRGYQNLPESSVGFESL